MDSSQTTEAQRPYGLRLFHAAVTGQALTSLGVVCMLRANVGLEPWSVLQQGLSDTFGFSFGVANSLVGLAAILIAVALGESIGLGTLFSVFLTGVGIDAIQYLDFVPAQGALLPGLVQLLVGLELLALGTWAYLREGLGEGSRDALMVALAKRTGRSAGFCRSCAECVAILCGWLLGGQVGIGTVVAMVGIGALIDGNFRLLRFDPKAMHHENLAETLGRLRRS